MLTVDFDRLRIGPGTKVLDVGCGAGRHAFEAYRRGGDVVALDQDAGELAAVAQMFAGMAESGEVPAEARARAVNGSALNLPYPDNTFDAVIAAEVLEHIPEDDRAVGELVRVLRPGGSLAVSVPRWLPERICWLLSTAYHSNEGGHVRVYRADNLNDKIVAGGLVATHRDHAHALHAPYWWLKCLVGVDNSDHKLVAAYHRLLVWDMMRKPATTRLLEAALNPLIGKSVVMYFDKQAVARVLA